MARRKLVCGDIHGNYKGLIQCLERSNFDYDNDMLIQIGDVVDGWSETYECVEELCKIRHLIPIKGNHDDWFNEYIHSGFHPASWQQGSDATAFSYLKQIGKEHLIQKHFSGTKVGLNPGDIPGVHKEFFEQQHHFYIDEENNLFIHGGFNRHIPLRENMAYVYWWDRDLWLAALSFREMPQQKHSATGKKYKFKIKDDFKEIFIGHTDTTNWGTDQPMKAANIWNLDTGSGWGGRLTVMDVDTKKYWQSDPVKELYPNEKGRG